MTTFEYNFTAENFRDMLLMSIYVYSFLQFYLWNTWNGEWRTIVCVDKV